MSQENKWPESLVTSVIWISIMKFLPEVWYLAIIAIFFAVITTFIIWHKEDSKEGEEK